MSVGCSGFLVEAAYGLAEGVESYGSESLLHEDVRASSHMRAEVLSLMIKSATNIVQSGPKNAD